MDKILFIVGPTAVGKTSLALKLAKKFKGEIISADSRQVYKGMDVGTGKDLPEASQYQVSSIKYQRETVGFYLVKGVRIWGYDLIRPDEEFSVAHFVKFAWKVIKDVWKRGHLPIVVGGTGFFLKSILNPPKSMGIRPVEKLRDKLEGYTLSRLQRELERVSVGRWERMNQSDRQNPRRLIRAIEVAYASKGNRSFLPKREKTLDILWVGLTAPIQKLDDRVLRRVKLRVQKRGMTDEVGRLRQLYPEWNQQAFSATGYREWRDYLEKRLTREKAISLWRQRERQYLRRQLTWFRKQKSIRWFDCSKVEAYAGVVELV